ncbi:MAG: radical SAM protein [Candidatus Omnitrophota bacterium]
MDTNYYSTISWVNEYARNLAPFVYVRREDNLLIKIPNQAHKLNAQGVSILKRLLTGENVYAIIERYADKEQAARDIHYFFSDLRAVMKDCVRESDNRRAVEKVQFSLPFNTLPVLSELAVTYRCNLACKFCYAACGCRKKEMPELSTAALKKILTLIKNEAEVPSVSFTGGEPLLRDDIIELIGFAKSLKMWTNLITNATLLTPQRAQGLQRAGLDSAQVSLEAGTFDLHDTIVAKEGAFALTLAGLKNLQENGIRVHTNTTISRLNIGHLAEILDLVKSLGLNKFSMNMLMPEGAALENFPQVMVSYSEIGERVLAVFNYAKKLGLEFMWYSPTPMCIFNPIVHGLGNKGCAACDGLLSIAPNGDILPCSSFPKPMGNILKIGRGFKKTWRSPKFAYFQKKRFVHTHCQQCADLAVCNGGCPLYWNKMGYAEILNNTQAEVRA